MQGHLTWIFAQFLPARKPWRVLYSCVAPSPGDGLRLLPHPGFEELFAQADGFRGDLDEFVFADVFEGVF
jgi:hypothetical protein